MSVTFERRSLYEQVWITPLSKLAPQYGLSDNGLRKVCKAMEIPIPPAGHWAKVAAGMRVERPLLPATNGRETFTSHPPPKRPEPEQLSEESVWLAQMLAFEDAPENRIIVDSQPRRWHPELRGARQFLIDADSTRTRAIRDRDAYRDRQARHPTGRPWGPNINAMQWWHLDTEPFLVAKNEVAGFRVSDRTFRRALTIANSLFFAADQRRCSVEVDQIVGPIHLKLKRARMTIAIRERKGRQGTDEPILALVFDGGGHGRELIDLPDQRLEERLNGVFRRLYRGVLSAEIEYRERMALEERQAQYREEARKEADRLAVEAKARAEEQARREQLLLEATSWQTAQTMRAYVKHVSTQTLETQVPQLEQWREWALRIAEEMDPTERRLATLAQNKAREPDPDDSAARGDD